MLSVRRFSSPLETRGDGPQDSVRISAFAKRRFRHRNTARKKVSGGAGDAVT
jgi:hypothetical protein